MMFEVELRKVLERYLKPTIKLVEGSRSKDPRAGSVLNLALSYAKDARFFAERGMLVEAFEAMTIAWAYVDSLKRMDLVEVPKELSWLLTTDKV